MEFKVIPDEQTPAVPKIAFSDSKLFIEEHRKELEAFLDFARSRGNAVGLAANQCSLNGERFDLRVFAIRNTVSREWSLVIDPHIDKYLGLQQLKAEGCLTWKGKTIVAQRYEGVLVDFFDMDGIHRQAEVYKGFDAQIWQHEINHLNGVEEDVRDVFVEPPLIVIGRNEPCPCGSGKKYKKCCLLF